ncbi:MAG: hypothetical protein LUQ50_13120 [Methanospirillum sp.]|uniref:hypothetical protein n=1 Tax=Methanospirillum sp. TaxID=45200 RepID=UPI00236A75FC|nr:hypothetical protein [Methanospirillum sp.]MDD1729997.1 hypothetical protein [Methanospirillum sp.]
MIAEVLSGISVGFAVLNGGGLYLLYRQYISLAESSLEFAAIVMESIQEEEDGTLVVDPVTLAGVSMYHLSQMSGIVKWIRG